MSTRDVSNAPDLLFNLNFRRFPETWTNNSELAQVKEYLYPDRVPLDPFAPSTVDKRQRGVDLIAALIFRNPTIPHAIVATANLTEASIHDAQENSTLHISNNAMRSIYAMPFVKFVNGFVDRDVARANTSSIGNAEPEDKASSDSSGDDEAEIKSKVKGGGESSMYAHAGKIDMPEDFVDLRHGIVHGGIPSLDTLREYNKRALDWLWEKWWTKNVTGDSAKAKAASQEQEERVLLTRRRSRDAWERFNGGLPTTEAVTERVRVDSQSSQRSDGPLEPDAGFPRRRDEHLAPAFTMNKNQDWEVQHGAFHKDQLHQLGGSYTSFSTIQKTITTLMLLTLGYYVLTFFDVWPDTLKRSLYDITVYLIPSPAIYILQAIMLRFSGALDDADRFKKSDYGDQRAKAEAIQRILGHSPFPSVLRKARSLSGLEMILPVSREIGPPGLGNWDNSCYQNSILQGLASLPAFRHYIEKSLDLCEETSVPATTHEALERFLAQLGDASERQTTLWTPAVLKSMDSWQQQDAQEYFSRVVEAVEKEDIRCFQVLKKRSSPGLVKPNTDDHSKEIDIPALEKVSLSDDERSFTKPQLDATVTENARGLGSFPRSPMDGMLAQALECQTCGFSEGYSLTQFNCLTLNMGLRGHSHLEDLLDDYTDAEMIDGVECTECTKALAKSTDETASINDEDGPSPTKRPKLKPVHRTKAKQITIGRLPKDLVVHINRSIFDNYGNQRKNSSLIRFPPRLDFLARWCAPLDAEEDKVQMSYELKCLVTHYGRHENGHYVALGKRDKDWYCFNDEIVTKMSEDEVLSRGNVFMLFYEAVDQVPLPDAQPSTSVAETAAPITAKELSESSTSSSESDALTFEEAIEPVTPVPAMRTASGSMLPSEKQDVQHISSALSVS